MRHPEVDFITSTMQNDLSHLKVEPSYSVRREYYYNYHEISSILKSACISLSYVTNDPRTELWNTWKSIEIYIALSLCLCCEYSMGWNNQDPLHERLLHLCNELFHLA